MSYSSDIAKILADQLTKLVTLNRYQLAGHVISLDFWMGEVEHCLDVIDGYPARFGRMRDAQAEYVTRHGTVEFDLGEPFDPYEGQRSSPPSPPKQVPHAVLVEARHQLVEAARRFLLRCYHERLIDETELRERCKVIGSGLESLEILR